jgi:hypothetical protein
MVALIHVPLRILLHSNKVLGVLFLDVFGDLGRVLEHQVAEGAGAAQREGPVERTSK